MLLTGSPVLPSICVAQAKVPSAFSLVMKPSVTSAEVSVVLPKVAVPEKEPETRADPSAMEVMLQAYSTPAPLICVAQTKEPSEFSLAMKPSRPPSEVRVVLPKVAVSLK